MPDFMHSEFILAVQRTLDIEAGMERAWSMWVQSGAKLEDLPADLKRWWQAELESRVAYSPWFDTDEWITHGNTPLRPAD